MNSSSKKENETIICKSLKKEPIDDLGYFPDLSTKIEISETKQLILVSSECDYDNVILNSNENGIDKINETNARKSLKKEPIDDLGYFPDLSSKIEISETNQLILVSSECDYDNVILNSNENGIDKISETNARKSLKNEHSDDLGYFPDLSSKIEISETNQLIILDTEYDQSNNSRYANKDTVKNNRSVDDSFGKKNYGTANDWIDTALSGIKIVEDVTSKLYANRNNIAVHTDKAVDTAIGLLEGFTSALEKFNVDIAKELGIDPHKSLEENLEVIEAEYKRKHSNR